jgi:hypothetical protein
MTTTNAQQDPVDAAVELRNGGTHAVPKVHSPECTLSTSRPIPSPQWSSQQGTVCNQDIESRRSRLKAVSGTPGSGSLLDDGTLSPDERDVAGTVDRLAVPVSGCSPTVDRHSSSNAAVVIRSSGSCSRPSVGNQFFGEGDVTGLRRSVTAANEETRGGL